jgi:glycogen(starch) synthase
VVAFIIMPAKTSNYNVDSLRGQATNKLLLDTVAELKTKIGQKIFETVASGNLPNG